MVRPFVLLLACAQAFAQEEVSDLVAIAREDRRQFAQEDHPYVFYLVADATTANVLNWVLSSTSLTQEIELCQTQPVAAGLCRIDIRNLGWRHEDWRECLASHPYGGYSMLVRGDWLITEILDTQLSASHHEDGVAAYYRLLYGSEVPQTESEFLKFWEIDSNAGRHRGQIEGISQVNRRGRRWIETRDRFGGYFFVTRDSLVLNTESDPLEKPDGSFRHDGSEAIVGVSKFSSTSFERGSVQYYVLTNGQGDIVNEAPVQLVEDSTRFRNVLSIRTWGSCLQCHVEGIRPIEQNALVELSQKYGTAIFSADPKELRRFHFGSLQKDVSRAQEDYAAGVKLHTGWTAEQLITAVESVVRGYDTAVDLSKAAQELGVEPARLQSVIRQYGQSKPIPAGIAVLAGGGECSRDLFAQQFSFLNELMKKGGN